MKLLPDGPDIPQDLLNAQEKGEVLFICGAGVSMTVGLPSFRGLVVSVYEALGENWNLHPAEREIMEPDGRLSGQYDRVLRCLERRMIAPGTTQGGRLRERLRDSIRGKLQPPDDQEVDLSAHKALLELSRDAESNIRLVTTNFDTLFERAWPRMGSRPSFAGPAMPQPKAVGCAGVMHLHGRLGDALLGLDETDLVLTSAEFGDAYLRSGWASRYVYDLVRAYTVVLVGYQADDPPMRYLLEVLEADRQRYADLRPVYAFARVEDDEELTRALWESKGVVPILHNVDADGSYGPLYRTLIEWRTYAQDPTAWRREQLRRLFADDPEEAGGTIDRVADLLRHGDASLLLSELNPSAGWLPLLRQQRIFDNRAVSPGAWMAARLNDADMIRAAAAHPAFDEQSVWYLERALEQKRPDLDPVRARAWELLLTAKKPRTDRDLGLSWYRNAARIRSGDAGYDARRLVTNMLRPRLKVERAYSFFDELEETAPDVKANENLYSFLRLDFEPSERGNPKEILEAWPEDETSVAKLLQSLERTLVDTLEHAEDVGFTVGYDRSDHDVPSVSPHAQNRYRNGFYPIVRVMADLWERLAQTAPERALTISEPWSRSQFVLLRRLAIFAATNAVHPAADLARTIMALDDHDFWVSGAQVELMRGLVARWDEFAPQTQAQIEARINVGIPRSLFDDDAFDAERWESVRDNAIYRRLSRLEVAGKQFGEDSVNLLKRIAERHTKWRPSPGDRDDFHSWSESRTGPEGDVDLLKDVPDATVVGEALRIESERQLDQGDLWRQFCSSDPDRAYRGLTAQAAAGNWNAYAWRSLFWAASDSSDDTLVVQISNSVFEMPQVMLGELASTIADWIRKHRPLLESNDRDEGSLLWMLWDYLATVVYADSTAAEPRGEDLVGRALNTPGGVLAWILIDHLAAGKPEAGVGLGAIEPRFTLIAGAGGEAGLLGRVHFARGLSYLHQIALNWATTEMLPRFQLQHEESLAMWKANSQARTGSAALFNALKASLLAVIPRPELTDHESGNLATRLLDVLVWHQLGSAEDYELLLSDVRDLLATGPARLREHFAWLLWRLQGSKTEGGDEVAVKGSQWRELVGPIFERIWPLDARLRTKNESENLVQMVMDTGDAFPAAVDTVVDFLTAYQIYALEHVFRTENAHADVIARYPRTIIKLTNALIDPTHHPAPRDLGKILDDCQKFDPEVINDPAFLRLNGFRRLISA